MKEPVMDLQSTFNKVAEHLFTQGKQAMSMMGACRYQFKEIVKTPKGEMTITLKCAVGCLIPDDRYDEKMESKDLVCLAVSFPDLVMELFGIEVDADESCVAGQQSFKLLCDLQIVHDFSRNWDSTLNMRSGLSRVATDSRLDSSILNKLSFIDR